MYLLQIKIIKSNGGMESQKFHVEESDYCKKDDIQYIYFKYIRPWFDKFPRGTILEWDWKWIELK